MKKVVGKVVAHDQKGGKNYEKKKIRKQRA